MKTKHAALLPNLPQRARAEPALCVNVQGVQLRYQCAGGRRLRGQPRVVPVLEFLRPADGVEALAAGAAGGVLLVAALAAAWGPAGQW